MSQTLTIRLTKELSQWLASSAHTAGVSQSQVVITKLEKMRKQSKEEEFHRISGAPSKDPPKIRKKRRVEK